MSDERDRWIEAGRILATDSAAQVLCPVCSQAYLSVEDVRVPDVASLFERYMRCVACGTFNSMRMQSAKTGLN